MEPGLRTFIEPCDSGPRLKLWRLMVPWKPRPFERPTSSILSPSAKTFTSTLSPMLTSAPFAPSRRIDRKSTRLNSSHTVIYTLSLHDALPISLRAADQLDLVALGEDVHQHLVADVDLRAVRAVETNRSEEHTSELQSHRDLHSFLTRRSSDLPSSGRPARSCRPRRRRSPAPCRRC